MASKMLVDLLKADSFFALPAQLVRGPVLALRDGHSFDCRSRFRRSTEGSTKDTKCVIDKLSSEGCRVGRFVVSACVPYGKENTYRRNYSLSIYFYVAQRRATPYSENMMKYDAI